MVHNLQILGVFCAGCHCKCYTLVTWGLMSVEELSCVVLAEPSVCFNLAGEFAGRAVVVGIKKRRLPGCNLDPYRRLGLVGRADKFLNPL